MGKNRSIMSGTRDDVEFVIRCALDDIACAIGTVAALYELEDDAVWSIMKWVDRLRIRLFRQLKGGSLIDEVSVKGPLRRHAAVKEFLERNRYRIGE